MNNVDKLEKELRQVLPTFEIERHDYDAISVYAEMFYTLDIDKLRKLKTKHRAMLWCDVRNDKVHFFFHTVLGLDK